MKNKEVLLAILGVAITYSLALYGMVQVTDIRAFGMYSNTVCAYEQQGTKKVECPSVMPGVYHSHKVSPQFTLNK